MQYKKERTHINTKVIFVGVGDKHYKESIASVKSFKRHHDIESVLITDNANKPKQFDEIVLVERDANVPFFFDRAT